MCDKSVRDAYLYSCLQGARLGSCVQSRQKWAPICAWGKLAHFGYMTWAINQDLIPRAEMPLATHKVRP